MTEKITTVQRLARNIAWLATQAGGAKLLAFVLNVTVVRHLGVSGYGELAFVMAFAGFFTVFGDFGLVNYAVREVAARKEMAPSILGRGLGANLFISVIIISVLAVLSRTFGLSGYTTLCILLAGSAYLLRQTGNFLAAFFRALEKMSLAFVAEIAYRAALLLFCVFCVLAGFGVAAITAAYLAASLVYLSVAAASLLKRVVPEFPFRCVDYLSVLRASLPYGLSSAAMVVYYNADMLMLSYFRGVSDVGIYGAAYNLYLSLAVISSVYLAAAFPVFSRLFSLSPAGMAKGYEKSFKFLLIIALPISFGGVLLADPLVTAVYGKEFTASAVPFAMLSSVAVFLYLNSLLGHFFAASGRVKLSLKFFGVACLLNVALNLFLIPRFGFIGAAASTMVSEAAYFFMAVLALAKTGGQRLPWRLIALLSVLSLAMTVLLVPLSSISVFARIAVGALIYGVMVLAAGVLDREDLALLREAAKR